MRTAGSTPTPATVSLVEVSRCCWLRCGCARAGHWRYCVGGANVVVVFFVTGEKLCDYVTKAVVSDGGAVWQSMLIFFLFENVYTVQRVALCMHVLKACLTCHGVGLVFFDDLVLCSSLSAAVVCAEFRVGHTTGGARRQGLTCGPHGNQDHHLRVSRGTCPVHGCCAPLYLKVTYHTTR